MLDIKYPSNTPSKHADTPQGIIIAGTSILSALISSFANSISIHTPFVTNGYNLASSMGIARKTCAPLAVVGVIANEILVLFEAVKVTVQLDKTGVDKLLT